MKTEKMKKPGLIIFLINTLLILLLIISGCNKSQQAEWISPYKEINWETIKQAKAQFHTHTTRSDGWISPQIVVDSYHKLGYDILSITDHWLNTWPWNDFASLGISATTESRIKKGEFDDKSLEEYIVYENRYPEKLDMLAILGSEPSHRGISTHHIVSLFSNITGQDMEFEETIAAAEKNGGLISFAHPGRSVEKNNNKPEDYIYYFSKYPNIYGIDIFTRATFRESERWTYTQELFATLLDHFGSPHNPNWRPLWFTATDDLHRIEDIDRAYQIQLVEEVTEENVYKSLKDGTFFWAARGPDDQVPVIESIEVKKNKLIVKGHGFDIVTWYFNNRIIHTGETFNLNKHGSDEMFYVFFIASTSDFSIEGQKGAMIGSQPFWIARK